MTTRFLESCVIEFYSGIPVYKQIINQICSALAAGVLKEGDRLPTIRQFHEKLHVNPNTIAKAYRELELKGTISSQRGNGSFVASSAITQKITPKEKEVKLAEIFDRMCSEINAFGISEQDLIKYINLRTTT